MPSKTCIVAFCPNEGTLSFPKDESLRLEWIKAIKYTRFGYTIRKTSRICSNHFKKSDFTLTTFFLIHEGRGRRRLKKNVVPSVFPWLKSYPPKKSHDEDKEIKIKPSSTPEKHVSFNNKDQLKTYARVKDEIEDYLEEPFNDGLEIPLYEMFEAKQSVGVEKSEQTEAMLEVCVDSLESALNAIHGGADEIEVCSCLELGGLTPSVGLVTEILLAIHYISSGEVLHRTCPKNCTCIKLTKKPKINVMIRCRSGVDYNYSQHEMDTMLSDINFFNTLTIDRYVFGALDCHGCIDIDNCTKIINKATSPVTFHRAFDVSKETSPQEAIEKIIEMGFTRLLTSGQRENINDPKAYDLIKNLIDNYSDKIEIMPGSGLSAINAKSYVDLGCKIVHGSCKGMNKHMTNQQDVRSIKAVIYNEIIVKKEKMEDHTYCLTSF